MSMDETFMKIALNEAKHSDDPKTKVGACIVNKNNEVLSVGYNRMPGKTKDIQDKFPWTDDKCDFKKCKHNFVCHAELNAIRGMMDSTFSKENCRIYVTLFPCKDCAKLLIQYDIKEIIYEDDKHWQKEYTMASKYMLDLVGIPYRSFSLGL